MWRVFALLMSLVSLQLITTSKVNRKAAHAVQRFKIPEAKHEKEFPPEKISIGNKRRLIDATELPGAFGGELGIPNLVDGSEDGGESGSGTDRDDIAYFKHLVRKHIADLSSRSDDDTDATHDTKHSETSQQRSKTSSGGKNRSKNKSTATGSSNKELITKINDIAKQIARVEHKEKIDRNEEAKLKVQKDVASKVIKMITEQHMYEKEGGKATEGTKEREEGVKKVEEKEKEAATEEKGVKEEGKDIEMKSNSSAVLPMVTSDEGSPNDGFECPWACFWTCHSYCPQECCHNPYKCSATCREICSPYCNDRCCAPGSQRLPKLKLSFKYGVEDRSKLSNNTMPGGDVKLEEAKKAAKEAAYSAQKEHQEKMALAVQMDAIRKASSYAARLIGLPERCPLTCARICLPSICKHDCCARRSNITEYHVPPKYTGYPSTAQVFKAQRQFNQQVAPPLSTASAGGIAATGGISATGLLTRPYILHECPPVCRSVCMPQCPNECCHNLRSRFDPVKTQLGVQ